MLKSRLGPRFCSPLLEESVPLQRIGHAGPQRARLLQVVAPNDERPFLAPARRGLIEALGEDLSLL